MNPNIKPWKTGLSALACVLLLTACEQAPAPEAAPTETESSSGQVVFDTPGAAIDEMVVLIEELDDARIEAVFGEGSLDLFRSGDDEADHEDIERIRQMIKTDVAFDEYDENTLVAQFGESLWPWPIPLVREGDGWRFDTPAGRDELLNRRIGRNELWTLTALHELVEAQREYYFMAPEGAPAYAARFLSSEGSRDGLYWDTAEDEEPSPLGGLLAESDVRHAEEPQPFHGYLYRILTAQGESAPGGARDYNDEKGNLTGGFAVIARPAKYGNSGVMTFITNHRGLVYQKDLGENTEQLAEEIVSFDPDETWAPTPDTLEDSHLLE